MNGLRKIWMMAAGLWCLMTALAQTVDSIDLVLGKINLFKAFGGCN